MSSPPPSREVAREEMRRLEAACADGGCPVCGVIRATRLALDADLTGAERAYLSGWLSVLGERLWEQGIRRPRA